MLLTILRLGISHPLLHKVKTYFLNMSTDSSKTQTQIKTLPQVLIIAIQAERSYSFLHRHRFSENLFSPV